MWEDGHEWRAVRDRRYTYARYLVDGKELLFDNQNDRYQRANLAEDGAYAEVLKRFRTAADTKMRQINDTFEASSFYKEHWVDGERNIVRTATAG